MALRLTTCLLLPVLLASCSAPTPDWAKGGPAPGYPEARYISAVGGGATPQAADRQAEADLITRMTADIVPKLSKEFASERINPPDNPLWGRFVLTDLTKVAYEMDGIQIALRQKAGKQWSLATLNRAEALTDLAEDINQTIVDVDVAWRRLQRELDAQRYVEAAHSAARAFRTYRHFAIRKTQWEFVAGRPWPGKSPHANAARIMEAARRALGALTVRTLVFQEASERRAQRWADGEQTVADALRRGGWDALPAAAGVNSSFDSLEGGMVAGHDWGEANYVLAVRLYSRPDGRRAIPDGRVAYTQEGRSEAVLINLHTRQPALKMQLKEAEATQGRDVSSRSAAFKATSKALAPTLRQLRAELAEKLVGMFGE